MATLAEIMAGAHGARLGLRPLSSCAPLPSAAQRTPILARPIGREPPSLPPPRFRSSLWRSLATRGGHAGDGAGEAGVGMADALGGLVPLKCALAAALCAFNLFCWIAPLRLGDFEAG